MTDDKGNLYSGNPDCNDSANQSGEGDKNLPGTDFADTSEQQAAELPGTDFAREAEDERKFEEERIRMALDEAESKKAMEKAIGQEGTNPASSPDDARIATAAEEISRAARAIYEAANGTPEEIEKRKKIIEADSTRRLAIMRERIGRNAEAFLEARRALERGGL